MEFFQANIQLKEVLVQLIAFVVVFLFLRAKVWRPVLALLESRRGKISDSFRQIESTKQELERLKSDYNAKLNRIEEEARSKMQEIIQEGKKVARELQDEARHQAKEILEKSKEDIRLETEKARVTLRKDIAALAFAATEKLIKEKISSKKDEDLISHFIDELEHDHKGSF